MSSVQSNSTITEPSQEPEAATDSPPDVSLPEKPAVDASAPKLRVLVIVQHEPSWLTQLQEDVVREHLDMVKDISVFLADGEADATKLRQHLDDQITLSDIFVVAEGPACRAVLLALPSLASPIAGVVFIADSLDGIESPLPSRKDLLLTTVCRPLVVVSDRSALGHWRAVSNQWQAHFSVDAVVVPSASASDAAADAAPTSSSSSVDPSHLVPELLTHMESAWISEHLTRSVPLVEEEPIRFAQATNPEIKEAKPLRLVDGKWVDEWVSDDEEDEDEDEEEEESGPAGPAAAVGEAQSATPDKRVNDGEPEAPDNAVAQTEASDNGPPRERRQSPERRTARPARPNPPRATAPAATTEYHPALESSNEEDSESGEVRGRAERFTGDLEDVKIGADLEETFGKLDLGLDIKF
ncbi:hypothetical protein M427DRAFT_150436 [Gonapodya prolifera JEL478]|uniref:Uncharacterized protein n=1 Tax=Gonapodya prolifera (strain JEL478) TaxID=1344416 RepID=A0A139AZZ8_GONPJ|nr:hypothetical protein M427DRAFT_150436 [Gonapodya prolifera JEL478]|eukprot:KXS22045.1 hypothetical protein M427DRAFT_150436 [Gonapodya prolifera JEL478]